jgi:hypothetical protein
MVSRDAVVHRLPHKLLAVKPELRQPSKHLTGLTAERHGACPPQQGAITSLPMPFSVRGAPQPILRRQLDILGSSFFEDSFDITEDGRQLEFNGETVESRSPTPQQERRYERGGFHFRKFASLARKDETFANYLGRRKVDSEHMHVLPESLKAADIRKIISIVAVRDEFLFELAQEVPNRKRHRRLRSKKVVPEIYTGAQAIFSICEGNPRWLIGLIRPC